MSDRVFFLLTGLALVAGFVLVRKIGAAGEAIGNAASSAADAVGEGARSLSDISLTVPTLVTRSLVDLSREASPNRSDPTLASPDTSFGGSLFSLRVALFGVPSDFPQASQDANPGLIGQLFN